MRRLRGPQASDPARAGRWTSGEAQEVEAPWRFGGTLALAVGEVRRCWPRQLKCQCSRSAQKRSFHSAHANTQVHGVMGRKRACVFVWRAWCNAARTFANVHAHTRMCELTSALHRPPPRSAQRTDSSVQCDTMVEFFPAGPAGPSGPPASCSSPPPPKLEKIKKRKKSKNQTFFTQKKNMTFFTKMSF